MLRKVLIAYSALILTYGSTTAESQTLPGLDCNKPPPWRDATWEATCGKTEEVPSSGDLKPEMDNPLLSNDYSEIPDREPPVDLAAQRKDNEAIAESQNAQAVAKLPPPPPGSFWSCIYPWAGKCVLQKMEQVVDSVFPSK